MLLLALQQNPNQQISVNLLNIDCVICIRQFYGFMTFSLTADGVSIIENRRIFNNTKLLMNNFPGEFFFLDSQGNSDPDFTLPNFSQRFQLYFYEKTN